MIGAAPRSVNAGSVSRNAKSRARQCAAHRSVSGDLTCEVAGGEEAIFHLAKKRLRHGEGNQISWNVVQGTEPSMTNSRHSNSEC